MIFIVIEKNEINESKIIHKSSVQTQEAVSNKVLNFDLILQILKKNIFIIEQRIELTIKEVTVIIDIFDFSLINFSGFKKLNGSQLVKENITYILNSLKSKISETNIEKKIIHIFNSKFLLDKKETENLPIGLFGNFYAHELSFFLINDNDYKNLINIFSKCNLKVKKIISKNFIEGVSLINENLDIETFFKIEINEKNTKLIYFENASLKLVQNFEFGLELILKDISKVLGFKIEVLKKMLINSNFSKTNLENELVEKEYFKNNNFRKVKKKLIFDIANSRIEEMSEIIMTKNINVSSFLKDNSVIYLKSDKNYFTNLFEDSFKLYFSHKDKFKLNLTEVDIDNFYYNADKIVQYGWKKEALPIVNEKKSLIARFFNLIFN